MIVILGGEEKKEEKQPKAEPSGGDCGSDNCGCQEECNCAKEQQEEEKCDCSVGPTEIQKPIPPQSLIRDAYNNLLSGGDNPSLYNDPMFWFILVLVLMVLIYIIMELRSIRTTLDLSVGKKVMGGRYGRHRY